MIPDTVRPVLARVIGAVVASAATALFRHLGHELTDEELGTLSDLGVALVFGVWGLVYAAVHKAISARTNPQDAAAPKIAAVATGPGGKEQRAQLATTLEIAASPAPDVTPEWMRHPPPYKEQ